MFKVRVVFFFHFVDMDGDVDHHCLNFLW